MQRPRKRTTNLVNSRVTYKSVQLQLQTMNSVNFQSSGEISVPYFSVDSTLIQTCVSSALKEIISQTD